MKSRSLTITPPLGLFEELAEPDVSGNNEEEA
jgi:hypothetical protein